MQALLPAALVLALIAGCAYPRRSTSLSPARDSDTLSSPPDVWRLVFTSAAITPRQRGGQPWDEDGSPPDAFVRLYRDDDLLFESSSVENQLLPEFEDAETENLLLANDADLRIELWDRDQVIPEPIGLWRGRGLPRSAAAGGEVRITLDGATSLAFRVLKPTAHRGTGVQTYEVRASELRVVEVLAHSPAGRAGLRAGDRIVAIDGEQVRDLGEARAASKLSMAGSQRGRLTVVHDNGSREELELDGGYVWRAR